MGADVRDQLQAQIEKVRGKVEPIFEQTDEITKLMSANMGEADVDANRKLYRIPIKLYQGGTFGKVSLNGGSMGEGTNQLINKFTAGFITTRRLVRITFEQVEATSSSDKAVINLMSDSLQGIVREAQIDEDILFHGDGTGRLTNAASATPAGNQLTFADPTDFLGVNYLREGMTVSVWNAAGTTQRAGAGTGPIVITNIDYESKTVTFNQAITSIAATDLLAIEGVASYGPTSLVTAQAGWPDPTVQGGLGGDSSRHGLRYVNDITGANYYLGIQRSTISQINPSRINGSGGITFQHGLALKDKTTQRRNADSVSKWMGIVHQAQRAAIFNIGTVIANKYITGDSFGRSLDNMPDNHGYEDDFEFCGMRMRVSKRQYRDRIDFVDWSKWGRVKLHDTKFYGEDQGRTVWEGRISDALATFWEFGILQTFDFVCVDPGSQGYIDNLTVPTYY